MAAGGRSAKLGDRCGEREILYPAIDHCRLWTIKMKSKLKNLAVNASLLSALATAFASSTDFRLCCVNQFRVERQLPLNCAIRFRKHFRRRFRVVTQI